MSYASLRIHEWSGPRVMTMSVVQVYAVLPTVHMHYVVRIYCYFVSTLIYKSTNIECKTVIHCSEKVGSTIGSSAPNK